mgnify:CR=1 FL=1
MKQSGFLSESSCYHGSLWQYRLWGFQGRDTKLEWFWTVVKWSYQMENWSSGELSKSAKISLSKSIFHVKIHSNLSEFFSLKITNWGAHFLLLITSIFEPLYFLKWCPIFDSLPLLQLSNRNFILLQLIFGQKPF